MKTRGRKIQQIIIIPRTYQSSFWLIRKMKLRKKKLKKNDQFGNYVTLLNYNYS